MATTQQQEEQLYMSGTAPTLLDRVLEAIKANQEERQELEEAFTKAENRYMAKMQKIDYNLETMRRVKERLTSGE